MLQFGDLGHGILMFLAGLYLVLREKNLEARQIRDEIFTMFFGGRYIILLMGLFSIHAGKQAQTSCSITEGLFRLYLQRRLRQVIQSFRQFMGESIQVIPINFNWVSKLEFSMSDIKMWIHQEEETGKDMHLELPPYVSSLLFKFSNACC